MQHNALCAWLKLQRLKTVGSFIIEYDVDVFQPLKRLDLKHTLS